MTNEELTREMKARRLKPGGKNREQMLECIRKEDRTQGRINWAELRPEGACQGQKLRVENRERKEEERQEEAALNLREVGETEWEDMSSSDEGGLTRREATLMNNAGDHASGRPRSTNVRGRPKGRGRTGNKGGRHTREDKVQDEGGGASQKRL